MKIDKEILAINIIGWLCASAFLLAFCGFMTSSWDPLF